MRLGRVEGDLSVGRNSTIRPESGGKVIVTGEARFEGGTSIECDFECRSMRLEGKGFGPGGDVKINGGLMVTESADIDASMSVSGPVEAGDLDVGGHFRSGQAKTNRLRVGGHLETHGRLEAEEVDVGGHMTVLGEVKIGNLRVGGHAKIGGGSVDGDIRVRGHFSTSKKLSFGRLEVYGSMALASESAGERLSALGKVEFEGDFSCRELEVTGTVKARGVLTAETINLKGNLTGAGNLLVSKGLQVWGAADVAGTLTCEILTVGGKLVAERISATKRVDIAGEVRTHSGLKSPTVVVAKGSKISGPIYAESADIGGEGDLGSVWGVPWWRGATGRPTTVEGVHGGHVTIRLRSRAGAVSGSTVQLEDGATAEEILFTDQVKLADKYFLTKPPRKVEELPDPPF